jgi:hypothetical protein
MGLTRSGSDEFLELSDQSISESDYMDDHRQTISGTIGAADVPVGTWDLTVRSPVDNLADTIMGALTVREPEPLLPLNLVAPQQGAFNLPISTCLSWEALDGALTYDVYLWIDDFVLLEAQLSAEHLGYCPEWGRDTLYRWWVVAHGEFESKSSETRAFRTAPPAPAAVVNQSPARGAINVSVPPSLVWSASAWADKYNVYFGVTHPPPWVATTSLTTLTVPAYEWSTHYFWQVEAVSSVGIAAGPVWSFTTEAEPEPPGTLSIDVAPTQAAEFQFNLTAIAEDAAIEQSLWRIGEHAGAIVDSPSLVHQFYSPCSYLVRCTAQLNDGQVVGGAVIVNSLTGELEPAESFVNCNANGVDDSCDVEAGILGLRPADTYATGLSPLSIVSSDFNDDGLADIAVANRWSHDVRLRLGMSDGTFGPEAIYTAGFNPGYLVAADLDNDNDVDLGVTLTGENSVVLFENDGAAKFMARPAIIVGSQPWGITCADLTGDGFPELGIANTSGTVSLLVNRGNLDFDPPTSLAVGGTPRMIALADFDGDLMNDLAVSNEDHGLQVLRGTGGTSFASPVAYPADGLFGIAVADLNRDGRPDVVGAARGPANGTGYSNGQAYYFENVGEGAFAAAHALLEQSHFWAVLAADLDLDGDVDVAFVDRGVLDGAAYQDIKLHLLVNDGGGGIITASEYDLPAEPTGITTLQSTGAGPPRLAVLGSSTSTTCVFASAPQPRSEDCNSNGRPDECDSIRPIGRQPTISELRSFSLCATGPGGNLAPKAADCRLYCLGLLDADTDGDVDLDDFARFQNSLRGG